jgi:hypothetical protein
MALLIDGHNLIARLPGLSLADPDDERELIQVLQRYAWRRRKKITVVFDPGDNPGIGSPASRAAVRVIYASPGSTADEVIVRTVQRHHNPRELQVVSSDRSVISAARSCGARTITATAFAAELESVLWPAQGEPEKPSPDAGGLPPDEVSYWLRLFRGGE